MDKNRKQLSQQSFQGDLEINPSKNTQGQQQLSSLTELRGQQPPLIGGGNKSQRPGITGVSNERGLNLPEIQSSQPKINQASTTQRKNEPRKDPGYDYVSLGSRIQDQINGLSQNPRQQRQQKNLSMQPPVKIGSQGQMNAASIGQRTQLQTPTNFLNQTSGNNGIKAILQGINGPNTAGQTPQSTTFENYLKKVIKSVERRKTKVYQIGDNQNQTQRLNQLVELDYQSEPAITNKNQSYGILALANNPSTTFQNFSNQIVSANRKDLNSQTGLIELQKQQSQQSKQQQKMQSLRDQQLAIVEESRVGDDSYLNVTGSGRGEASNYDQRMMPDGKKRPEHKATEQVVQLLKETQKKEKIFIPLEKSTDVSSGYIYHEMKHPPQNHAGIVVFSKQGFVTVGKEKNATSDFISNDDFIANGVNKFILSEIPFFKKFQIMRLFKQWKYIMRWNVFQRKRVKLAESFFFAKPIFSEKYSQLITDVNTIRTLPFMEIKKNITYGKKQQSMLDERCKSKLGESKEHLDKLLGNIKATIYNLKVEIQSDDKNFENGVKELRVQALIKQKRHGEELVMFSKARKQKENEEEQYRIQRIRHVMYDKFVEFVLKFVCGNLVELLYENKCQFKEIFKDQKNGPQFEAAVCFNQKGKLDTDPSMEDHYVSFLLVFENMEKAVYQNQTLIEFISDIVSQLFKEKKIYYKSQFSQMELILKQNRLHQENNDVIFETLKRDIQKCREYLEQFIPLQEIYDFAKDWETNKKDQQLSSEMGFYKETWLMMDRYNGMIDKIPPGNTKLGTILVETLSLKKYLHELPKRVIDSIRHNVTLTMETETKSLREELSKTSEILDQLPTSLNVYVEQVNTLKYVKEKQEDFSQKFQTINKLHQLCKQDNIKVSLTLQLAIDEVSHLYESLPKLQKTAAEGLSQNKDTMEKIMQSSSLVLSKKIKAFEKKYVETYLQDKSRLEDCADTLEELFKRSSKNPLILLQFVSIEAIHEIRSKVILYKEFLKLLYEDDPDAELKLKRNKLQCSDDYEFVQSIHKETIKLWKMLLYWRKRRQMCYNSPFLSLDTNKIIRSINKINRYFEEKLSKNDFLRDKSRPLCKVVILQVKETSLIIEFLKDLRKESLQQRHWLQIFNLIKAPHLKNSNSFTIVNLREYHIQNYREEIAVIIEHANTELKYEKIFKSIKEEWESLELKIIPYKETMDSYILTNTETLSNAIEENLTTLETISQSKYAEHVRQDIADWVRTLKVMLKNLEIWVIAQKHWINLDPIFQSAQLEDILGQDSSEFQEYRNQFKRIMWSAFKNPKATYNLMITSRIEVFENLIKYFSVLQKKVHNYLEQRRLAFPRFFFLTDSQFLEFLTLTNSNQDFNDFISVLFQGAKSLYINRVLGLKKSAIQEDQQIDNLLRIGEELNDNKIMQTTTEGNTLNVKGEYAIETNGDQDGMNVGPTPYLKQAIRDKEKDKTTIDADTISQDDISLKEDAYSAQSDSNIKQRGRMNSTISQEFAGVKLGSVEKDLSGFQILGMIGHCKELFLFEKSVAMKNGVEQWLQKVEEAMQETIAKQINYAVSSFPKQSLDEWILDYPQQVILTTIHLILSHEINELLEDMAEASKRDNLEEVDPSEKNEDDDEEGKQAQNQKLNDSEEEGGNSHLKSSNSRHQSKRNNLSSAGHNTFSKRSSKKAIDDDDDSAMRDYLKKKNELKAQQKAEEELEKRRQQEEQRIKMEANEPPKDPEKEKRRFVDEMFGRDFPADHQQLVDKVLLDKSETDPLVPKKPPSFKEVVMTLLQRKSFQGLFLRLQFWINQIIKSLYPQKYGQLESMHNEIDLHSVQKMEMKSIITFLVFQREVVENLIKKNVTHQNDFEWQSQVRLLWTGIEPGCRVDCGGWSTYQQNEYLGCSSRLAITPLTNRYFIFISAALREKSAVMFKCAPSEQKAGDVFEEFSNICSVPFRRFQCNPIVQMKVMMQHLNGAALASVWVFFEHVDKLPFAHFQAFNKEIQMVQQQFIIAELSANEGQNASLSKASQSQMKDKNMLINENTQLNNGASSVTNKKIVSQLSSMPQSSNITAINQRTQFEKSGLDQSTPKSQNNQTPFTKAAKICFGVFGSVSHSFIINHSDLAQQLLSHSQSAFRIMALTRPNEIQVFKILLKKNGFDFYEQLASQVYICIEKFYEQKQELQNKINSTEKLSVHEHLTQNDMKIISKLSQQLFRYDWQSYIQQLKDLKMKNYVREVLSINFQKTKEDKIADLEKLEAKIQEEKDQRALIETNAIKSSLHLYLIQKFTNQWMAIYDLINKEQAVSFNEIESHLEFTIQKSLEEAFISESDKEQLKKMTDEQRELIQMANIRKLTISNSDIFHKFKLQSGSSQLIYDKIHEQKDQEYVEKINRSLKVVTEKLHYDKVNAQLRNCIQFIEYLGRTRGIALIGPTCSGKTSILKIVSNVLNLAFNVKMRTSVINSSTYSQEELYGTIESFSKNSSQAETDNSFNKQGIFQIVLDVFEKERNQMNAHEKKHLIQSIFLDSVSIDSTMSESLIKFMIKSNKRESMSHSTMLRKILDLEKIDEIVVEEVEECIPISMPNSNVVQFPQNLYIFFEATSLKDSSPSFISKIGLVVTEDEDIQWKHLMFRNRNLSLKRHGEFFKDQGLNFKQHFDDCWGEFLEPFIEAIIKSPKVQAYSGFKIKSAVLQFFNILNSVIYRIREVTLEKNDMDEENMYMLRECERDIFWSTILLSLIWSFGATLNRECRKVFEENFFNYRRRFNINITGPARQRFTLFDIYYDPENLNWDLLQEKLEYKLKLHYDAQYNTLMIPTVEVSQAYFLMDVILGSLKHDDSLDKHFRLLGPSGTSKSIALNTFIKKYSDQYNSIIVPMSCYLTLDKLKKQVESFYHSKRRNQLEPLDKNKKLVFIIDDLHLQSNLKVNVLEFIRTWCVSKGYYDIKKGFFKNIGEFGTIMAENSEYRVNYCKAEGRNQSQSRLLFYANTLYIDEYDFDRYKLFIQHWLTSKMWSTSKIINKYYILMTNTIMTLMDKLKRQEYFHNTTFLRLTNFHIFAKFCSNLANYTLISDETKEIMVKGQKEEDAAANMMIYELMRSFGDRIMLPNHRTSFIQRVVDACKQEFITGNHLSPKYCDDMLLGNYHNRRPGAHIKYLYVNNDFKAVREEIREKIRRCSNNHFLETFLDAPNGLKEIFRLSRVLFKEMQHLILIGHSGSGMHEYLQLATILNDGLIFELNVTKFGDPLKFAQVFKQAVQSAVQLNSFAFLILNDQQVRDTSYIDYTFNFMTNIIKNENCIIMDDEFKQTLIDIEKELVNQNSGKKTLEQSNDVLFLQALRKIQKNVHIVFMISDHSTYYEWVSLFPSLEHKCEVIYMDELSSEGYKQLTAEFFQERDTDNTILNNQNLIKSLVEARQITKHKILSLFYSQQMLQYTCNEEYIGTQAGEYVFNSDKKLHGFLYENGSNQINDPSHKQLNYNIPVHISTLYKARYVMFLELFRFLYDFLSMNLVIRRNYFETFLRKASEFQDFFKDIKSTKSVLHGESNQMTFKLATLKDKIHKIQQIIHEKEQTIGRRQKDIADLEIELKNNKDELYSVIYEKDKNIDDILDHLEKINGSEFSYVISLHNYKPNERALLDMFAIIIQKDHRQAGYDKKEFDMYFLNREELINLLTDRRNYEYDDICFTKLKDFINQYAVNDFKDRPLFKQLFNFLMELYRKLNVRNTMSGTFTRIKEIKEQIDSSHFSINYSRQFIEDKKEEMEGLKNKYERIKDQEHSLSKRIEEAEISHMRTEHIFIQVEKYTNKIYAKLTDVKKRIEYLLGDCIIMASSVAFLGVFSMKERLATRKEIYDYITNGCAIKCSPCWEEVNPALNSQSKLFKQVIKEYGLRKVIQNHNFSGIISQTVVIEALFSMIFSPSCPYLVDPTGQLQEFIQNKLLSNLKIKQVYASDGQINSKLESILRSSTFALLNDINDMNKDTFGLCHDEPLLHRLSTTTHNGFDFDYERLTKLKHLHSLSAFHNSYQSVNKRISTSIPEFENLSFYQVQIFTPRYEFTLNREYQSKVTQYLAMNNDAEVIRGDLATAPWVEIKELMLKHFLPDSYKQLQQIQNKLKDLDLKKSELNKNFENAFLVANQDTLQNINEYTSLKQSVEDIRYSQEERLSYQKNLQDLLNEKNLLNSYSNILTIMYISLKKLSKISGELTYSWKMYLSIIDQILLKVVRDLNTDQLQSNKKKDDQSSGSISVSLHGHAAAKKSKNLINPVQIISSGKDILDSKEFTIDEQFFSTTIIPSIYSTIISGIKQIQVPMYNLILSILIAIKKKDITETEAEFFYKNLFLIKDFHLWRYSEKCFVDLDARVEKTKFISFKREILKAYPDIARKVMEQIEKDCGQSFSYKVASLTIYGRIFAQNPDFKHLTLMQKINIGFLCPDHEFTSKICQLVYEQLSSLFAFSEELVKLHNFIKTASWQHPIALLSQTQINVINTVCSIASYYGVGLEVLRTDLQDNDNNSEKKNQNQELTQQILDNLQDYSKINTTIVGQYKNRLGKEAVTYQGLSKRSTQVCDSKINYDCIVSKNNLGIEDKQFSSKQSQEQNPLKTIENCAIQGSWVFISTLKFPSFWPKMCQMLEILKQQNKIANTFRVFVDLQGYQQNEIPDSFLFNHSISFYLTDQNNEDMEGFNDVWANILNDKILNDLTQVEPAQGNKEEEEVNNQQEQDPFGGDEMQIDQLEALKLFEDMQITQDKLIKDDKQRELYLDFLKNQMQEDSKNNSNTLIFGSEPTIEYQKQESQNSNQDPKKSDNNLNDLLSDIKSMGSVKSQDKSYLIQNQVSWKDGLDQNRVSLNQKQVRTSDLINDDEESKQDVLADDDEDQGQNNQPQVSRINSIHNSMDLSRGENQFIQELQTQFDEGQALQRRQTNQIGNSIEHSKKSINQQEQRSLNNIDKSLIIQNQQNSHLKVSQDQEELRIKDMKFDDITDIEANQAFSEFQNNDDNDGDSKQGLNSQNQQLKDGLNDTSDLI